MSGKLDRSTDGRDDVTRSSARIGGDLVLAEPVISESGAAALGADRLAFDGYKLRWLGSSPDDYDALSGPADESARESVKDLGPTPQGLFAVDPASIEDINSKDADAIRDWGTKRVRIEPYASTVMRMTDCFKVIRTGMYIHGGSVRGTSGCVEINDAHQHSRFFRKLKSYGKKIELEVKYVGPREIAYEEPSCPY